jgi:pimeloyl-ACP methyl ester carboxylesterase
MWDDYDWGTRRAVLRLYRATDDPGRAAGALSAALAPLRRPGLVVWGRRDPYIGAEYAERQREVFDAGVVMLDESGHWPFADDAAAVEAAVVPFLRVQTAGAR